MLIYHIRNSVYYTEENSLSATGGYTVALDIKFPDFTNNSAPLSFIANIGLSVCHNEDNYNRKIGRELALSKLSPREFKLSYCYGDNITYITYITVSSISRQVSFTINKLNKKNRVSIVNVLDSFDDNW